MKEKIYFKNLNGLRFIAASFVIICHIELLKKYFQINNFREQTKYLGELGVDLFFVLSGFLITFLLLKEKEVFQKINYKAFYLRRILRIWPLYYIIVILSLFIVPNLNVFNIPFLNNDIDSKSDVFYVIILFVLMLPNVLYFLKPIQYATQTWSIGVEEQFYLIWPFVINKTKKYKTIFICIILLYWLLYFVFKLPLFNDLTYIDLIRNFYNIFKIDVLTIGSIAAILLFENNSIIHKIVNIKIFVLCLLLLLFFYLSHNLFVERIIYSVLFSIVILNLVRLKSLSNALEFKMLNYLGQISYGIYMYHGFIILLVMKFLMKFNYLNNILLYILSFLFTIIASSLSYKYIEKPFLKLKLKFSYFENEKK